MNKYFIYGAGLMLLGLAGFASGAIADTQARTIIKLHQAPPELHNIDAAPAGHSDGDILTYEAQLTGENGRHATVDGYLIIVDEANADEPEEDRFSHMVVDFGEGSTIVVEGRSAYSPTAVEMANNKPRLRAVVGGTGEYIGARGQVSTWRNADGSYDHTIELLP